MQTSDAEAFLCQPGLGWGASVVLEETDTASCPDVLPLGWSGSGRGDYRESPLELGGVATDFRYDHYEILDGIAPMESGLPQALGEAQTLKIVMVQPGAELILFFTVFEDAMTRRVALKNTGKEPVQLTKLMSSMMELPGDYEMTTFDGGWIAEMREHRVPVLDSRIVNESVTGFSSHRHNPGFLLSQPGATETDG